MKRNVILSIFLISTGLLLAQPGRPKGPGGQYGERMEMMMIWNCLLYTSDAADE